MIHSSKYQIVEECKNRISEIDYLFVVNDLSLTARQAFHMREKLQSIDADVWMMKNKLAKIAFNDTQLKEAFPILKGRCILVCGKDPNKIAKTLQKIQREYNEAMHFTGMVAKVFDLVEPGIHSSLKDIANLMNLDQLRAQCVFTLNSLFVKIVSTMNTIVEEKK